MSCSSTWYPPAAGCGSFLLANLPFVTMTTLIHLDDHDFGYGPRWRVEQGVPGRSDPWLVRFVRFNATKIKADNVARWDQSTGRWQRSHWIPQSPGVPRTLLRIVEEHLRKVVA